MSQPRPLPTSLGPSLEHRDGVWHLDLARLPMLHGLSVLSRALAEMVVQHARSDRFDVAVERKLRSRENPELVEAHGIETVRLVADATVVEAVVTAPELFERRLRALLGSLQRERNLQALLGNAGDRARALVAAFGDVEPRQRMVLEHVPARREAGRGALRITVESDPVGRLHLAAVPHVTVDGLADRAFLAGSTRIAQTWTEALRREAERGRRSFTETRSPHSHAFRQFDQAGWSSLQRVALQWSAAAHSFLLESDPDAVSTALKRVLLACEDRHVRERLLARDVVRVDTGELPVFLDQSQLGRVLAISLGQRRERSDADAFLRRMPSLSRVVHAAAASQPLRGVRVFLVHHMTAEIVGTIAALRRLGCTDLTCVFVTYAGEPPASYLDAVLDLPVDEFRGSALVNVPQAGHVEGHYLLSTHYSQIDEAPQVAAGLQRCGSAYLPAMRATAAPQFLALVRRAADAGDRVLLVEDGGYLAPVVQDALLRGHTVGAFAASCGHDVDDPRPLAELLATTLVATVEHTRNGFDRLAEVEAAHGCLALPSFSIAISRLKRVVESREVAASVLNAVETVLNADGLVLARRHCLVLGSHGAIGSALVQALRGRLDDAAAQLCGVDLRAPHEAAPCFATGRIADLPAARWLATDLVIGATGVSLLDGELLEAWLAGASAPVLVLASASTKKVEFRTAMAWFDALATADQPRVAGRDVQVGVEELVDPRTARLYGHRWRFVFVDDGRERQILALANLTPINFLFYGVATELIDEVLAELATLSVGALSAAPSAPRRLLAVDRDVDAHARSLPGSR